MQPILIGIDLGTTLCKCGAYDTVGNLICSTSHQISINHAIEGGAEQNPEEWISAITSVMTEIAQLLENRVHEIGAIGVSCHGPGIVLTDANGQVLLPCAIWQDNRSAAYGKALLKEVGCDWVGHGMPQTGLAARLRWLYETQPDIVKKAARIHGVKGFLLSRLTGKDVVEPSSSGGIESWSDALLAACGGKRECLDTIIPSTGCAGMLTEEMARHTGFPVVPVIGGLNDGAAAMLGAGAVNVGDGVVSVSTNGIARVVVDSKPSGQYLYDHSLFCWSYVDGKYVMGGFTKSAGDTVQWWQEMAYSDVPKAQRMDLFNQEAAQSTPGSHGVLFYPWLLGRGAPAATDTACGSFMNLARHHGRGDCSRAVMEGLSYALFDIGMEFRRLGYAWENIRLTGGAMKSDLWRTILCNVLAAEGKLTESDSLLGAAMMAGIGCGVFANAQEACKACVREIAQPPLLNKELTQFYQNGYRAYVNTKDILSQYQDILNRYY